LPSQAEGVDDGRSPYVTATAVTTRTATTHEDKEKNAKTSQVQCIIIVILKQFTSHLKLMKNNKTSIIVVVT
jgi:hypothetical protein